MEKSRRNYNVFFNLHTVSGIAISVGIFVCFFAGAYALFLNEIDIWQYNTKITDAQVIDYDRVLHIAKEEGYQLTGRKSIAIKQLKKTGEITIGSGRLKVDSLQVNGAMSPKDSLAHAAIYLRIDPTTYEINSRERPKYDSHLGTFLYHLHFFEQIPTAGIFLSGFVSLFLVFSIFTGIIVHWKKIRSNFFTFRLKSSVKNFWTDGHTALGIIGIPYQLMYGVTGVFLGGTVIFAYLPTILVLEGNTKELGQLIYPKNESPRPTESEVLDGTFFINTLVERTVSTLDANEIGSIDVNLSNYGKIDAAVNVSIIMDEQSYFSGTTSTKYRLADGEIITHKPIEEKNYAYYPRLLLKKIHYATFGGYFIKIVYFLLALATCYVILSGVMIWLVAREKKTYAHKARFNRNVGAIFIGSCMGLYPAIAFFFCLVK
ncbi:MAG: PepSY-associated TM helix domain-containing protein, partial [Bacteroidota bacterium]